MDQLFQQRHIRCDNKISVNCPILSRLFSALYYYHQLQPTKNVSLQREFTQFCLNTYHDLLDDYSHLISHHSHQLIEIKSYFMRKYNVVECKASQCQQTQRYFTRIRGDEKIKEQDIGFKNPQYTFYSQIFDAIHFYIFHLYEVGLRRDSNNQEEKNESTNLVPILERGKNKFNINVVPNVAIDTNTGETFIEGTIPFVAKHGMSESNIKNFYGFLQDEEYDTDALIYDVED
eukprot:277916_1